MEPLEGSEQREGHVLSQVLAGPLQNRLRLGDGAGAGQDQGGGYPDGPLDNGSGQALLDTPRLSQNAQLFSIRQIFSSTLCPKPRLDSGLGDDLTSSLHSQTHPLTSPTPPPYPHAPGWLTFWSRRRSPWMT